MTLTYLMAIFMVPVVMALTFVSRKTHLLMSLLALEGLMLSMVLLLPLSLSLINMPISVLSLIILTLGACEASLGLSLLVSMSRSFGSDQMKMSNL